LISTGFEKTTDLGFACCDPKIVARYDEPFARKGGSCFGPEDFAVEKSVARSVVTPIETDLTPNGVGSVVPPIETDLTSSGVGSDGFALATVAEDDEEPS
jgi:hypothetical protein